MHLLKIIIKFDREIAPFKNNYDGIGAWIHQNLQANSAGKLHLLKINIIVDRRKVLIQLHPAMKYLSAVRSSKTCETH